MPNHSTASGPDHPAPPPLPSQRPRPPDREALIDMLLDYALTRWEGERHLDRASRHVVQNAETGEIGAQSHGPLLERLGTLTCVYCPREAVSRMIDEITETVNTTLVRVQTPTGYHFVPLTELVPPEFLEQFTIDAAGFAAYSLVSGAFVEATYAMRRNFRHARAFAATTMQGLLSSHLIRANRGIVSAQIDVRDIIGEMKGESAKEVDAQLRKLFGVVPHVYMGGARGRRTLWTKAELRRELRQALTELPPERRGLQGLFSWIKEKHPLRAPKSAQALKQLLYDKGLRLKDLKGVVRKGRKN